MILLKVTQVEYETILNALTYAGLQARRAMDAAIDLKDAELEVFTTNKVNLFNELVVNLLEQGRKNEQDKDETDIAREEKIIQENEDQHHKEGTE